MKLSLTERGPIYAWLAELLVREVDATVWRRLQQPAIRDLLVRLEPELATALAPELEPAGDRGHAERGVEEEKSEGEPEVVQRRERLREEYARLFLVPGGVSPLVSSWLEPKRTGAGVDPGKSPDVAVIVARGFEALGRAPRWAEPWGRLPLDHVALVFELAAQIGASRDPADRALIPAVDELLLEDWPARFGAALTARAEHPLYRALGRAIEALHAEA